MDDQNEGTAQYVLGATSGCKEIVLYNNPKEKDNLVASGDPLPIVGVSWDADWAW